MINLVRCLKKNKMDVCNKKMNKIKKINKVLKSAQNLSLARRVPDKEAAEPLCLLLYSKSSVRHSPVMGWEISRREQTMRAAKGHSGTGSKTGHLPSVSIFISYPFSLLLPSIGL